MGTMILNISRISDLQEPDHTQKHVLTRFILREVWQRTIKKGTTKTNNTIFKAFFFFLTFPRPYRLTFQCLESFSLQQFQMEWQRSHFQVEKREQPLKWHFATGTRKHLYSLIFMSNATICYCSRPFCHCSLHLYFQHLNNK